MSYLILSASVITDRHSRPFLNAFALVRVTSRKSRPPKRMIERGKGKAVRAASAARHTAGKSYSELTPFLNTFMVFLGEVTDRY